MDKNLYYTRSVAAMAARKERACDIGKRFLRHASGIVGHWATSVVLITLMTVMGSNAYAKVHFSQNYEASGVTPDWVSAITDRYVVSIAGDDSNHYLQVSAVGNGGNGTTITSNAFNGILTDDVVELTLSFDLQLTPGNNQSPNEFFINDGGSGYVFHLGNTAVGSTTWEINKNSSQTVVMDKTKWYSFTVDVSESAVYVSVTDKSSGEVVFARQKVKNGIAKFGLGTMTFYTKRYYAGMAIDNVNLYCRVTASSWDFTQLTWERSTGFGTESVTASGAGCTYATGDLEGLAFQGGSGTSWVVNEQGLTQGNGDRSIAILDLAKNDIVEVVTETTLSNIHNGTSENGEYTGTCRFVVSENGTFGFKTSRNAYIKKITVYREKSPIPVSYTKGNETGVEGDVPEASEQQQRINFKLPVNTSLYKSGYTLLGWNDGVAEDTLACGSNTYVLEETVFSAVFGQNKVDRTDSKAPVKTDLNDVAWTTSGTQKYYVAQATFNGEVQDVGAVVDGKVITLLDVVKGTKITFPEGTAADYSAADVTVEGDTWTYTGSATTLAITYSGTAAATSLKLTFPITLKPVITTDVNPLYAAKLNSEFAVSVVASQAQSYQWYSNTEASTTGGTAIAGANSSTYNVPTAAVGNYYYYCEVSNESGSVLSSAAKVRVDDYVTLDILSLSAEEMKFTYEGTRGWSGVERVLERDSVEWEGLPLIYPYSLAGYLGIMNNDESIESGKGFTNNSSRGDRSVIMYDLKEGDVVVINGKNLTGGQFAQSKNMDGDFDPVKNEKWGRCTVDSIVSEDQSQIIITMLGDGDLTYLLRRGNIQEIHSIMMPNKYRPTMTSDLDGQTHTLARGETMTLSVSATAGDSNELRYQWYRNDADNLKAGTDADGITVVPIEGATSPTYTTEPNTSYYYFCVVFNTATHTAAVTPHTTRVQCKPYVTYASDETETIGVLPPSEIVEIGGQHTVEPSNQLFYKAGSTITEWEARKVTDDSLYTYNFGEAYHIVNDMEIKPVFVENAKSLDDIIKTVEQVWQFGTQNGAPAVQWTDESDHSLVIQSLVAGETQDVGIIVNSAGFDNTTAGDYVDVADGTTLQIPVKGYSQVVVYAKEGETPTVTFKARDMKNPKALSGEENVLSYQYIGADSLATLTLSAGKYEKLYLKHIPSGMPVIQTNLEDNYYAEAGRDEKTGALLEYTLTVEASELCRYQWYKNNKKSTEGGTPIVGATTMTLNVSRETDGTDYYYMTATNDHGTVATNCTRVDFSTYVTYDFTKWDWEDAAETGWFTANGVPDPNNSKRELPKTPDDYWLIRMPGGSKVQAYDYPYGLRGLIGCYAASTTLLESKGGLYNGGGGGREMAIPNMKKGQHITMTGDENIFKEFAWYTEALYDKNNRGVNVPAAGDTIWDAAKYKYELFDDDTRVEIDVLTDGAVVFYNNPRYHTLFTVKRPSLYTPVLTKDLEKEYAVHKDESLTLSIAAELAAPIDGHSLIYQWFVNTKNSNKGGKKIADANEPTYTIEKVDSAAFYYCLISNSVTEATVPTSPAAVGYYVDVTFHNDDAAAYGETPKTVRVQSGLPVKMEVNQTLYKPGYTLTGWTDGTTETAIGDDYIPTQDVTLLPMFTENSVDASLAARTEPMTVLWTFSTANGSAEYNGNASANVVQVSVNKHDIDLGIGMSKGDNQEEAEMNTRGWMKAQNGDFTIPVVKNTKINVSVYNTSGITINGNAIAYTAENGTTGEVEYEYTYTGAPGNITLNVGNNYLKQIVAEYPAPEILKANNTEYSVKIDNAKVSRKSAVVALEGLNLTPGAEIRVMKDNNGTNVTVEPETFNVAADGTVNQQVLVTYSQTGVQADGTTVLKFFYSDDLKPEVTVAYGRTVASTASTVVTPVSDKTVWDWSRTENDITPVANSYMTFSDVTLDETVTWPAGLNAENLAGSGTFFANNSMKSFEGAELYFEATRKGTIEVEFSATGNGKVTLAVNGVNTTYSSSSTTKIPTGKIPVEAGGVLIQGREQGLNSGEKNIRVYKLTFIPDAETPTITLDKSTSSFTLSTTDMTLEDENPDKETIYYTTDGTKPTRESRVYEGTPIALATNCTIRAIAMATGKNNSEVAELVTDMTTYKLDVTVYPSDEEGRLEFSPASEDGTYTENAVVTVRGYAKNGYGLLGWTTTRENIGRNVYYSTEAAINVTINSTANNYFAVFATGPEGTVNYDISKAVYLTKTGENLIDYNARMDVESDQAKPEAERQGYTLEGRKSVWAALIGLEYMSIQGYDKFTSPITSTSISVPSNYPLHTGLELDGSVYTLQYWLDANGNRYDLGTNTLFTEDVNEVTIYPVFKQNEWATFMDTRKSGFEITWDFRNAYGAHPLTIPSGEGDRFYTSHTTMDYYDQSGNLKQQQEVALPIKINTENVETTDEAFTNEDLPEWATLKPGTKVTLPSSYGAQFTVASYAEMMSDGLGTTINGRLPDNIHEENIAKTDDGAYLYTWTMETDDREVDLIIGNSDYSYYKYIKAVFKAADMMYLKYSTNNVEQGTVKAQQVDNEDYNPELTDLGYPYPKSSTVRLTATRNTYYRLLYWQDDKGAKIYPDGSYELANGTTDQITSSAMSGTTINGITYLGCTDEEDNKYTLTFTMDRFHDVQAVFGDTVSYYVNFNVGDGAGIPLPQQHIEKGSQLVMPASNYNLYRDGYTLKYYVEVGNEDAAHYEFGRSYQIDHNMRLKPVFVKNTKSIDEITDPEGVVAVWNMNAMQFDFPNSNGHIVAQLPIDAENSIDMVCYIEAKNANAHTVDGVGVFTSGASLRLTTTIESAVTLQSVSGLPFTAKQMTIGGKDNDAGATVTMDTKVTTDSTFVVFNDDETRVAYFSVRYKPVTSTLALKSVKIGKTALTEDQMEALRTTFNHNHTCDASVVYTADDVMPEVTAEATEDGQTAVTQATVQNPTAVVLLKKKGVTIQTYNINFTLTGKVAPKVDSLKVNSIMSDTLKIEGVPVPDNTMTVSGTQKSDGVITISFDHSMTATDVVSGADGLNQTLAGSASGRTVMLTYWNLDGGREYTLNIPANTFTDIYGVKFASPIKVTFTTSAVSTSTSKKQFDFVVTHKLDWDPAAQVVRDTLCLVSDDVINELESKGIKYGTFEAALDSANANEGSQRFYIFVPNGEYNVKGNSRMNSGEISGTAWGNDENGEFSKSVVINVADYNSVGGYYTGRSVINRSNVSIIGQSQDGTLIYNEPKICGTTNSTDSPVFLSSTMRINSDKENTYFQDLTFENRFCNSQSSPTTDLSGAPAFYDNGLHTICKNVTMKAHELTYSSRAWEGNGVIHAKNVHKTDNYYEDCAIWGTYWLLHDQGQAWFERPTFVLRYRTNSSTLTATEHYADSHPWGYVLHNGVVTTEDAATRSYQEGRFYLGTPLRLSPAVNFINMKFDVTPNAVGYTKYNGALCRFHEYGSKNRLGNDLDLSLRSLAGLSPEPGSDECVISASQAAMYTVRNVLSGDNAYDPTIYTKQVSMSDVVVKNASGDQGECLLQWADKSDALCYFIFSVDKTTGDTLFHSIVTNNQFNPGAKQKGKWFVVRAANERGGLGAPSEAVQYMPLDVYTVSVKEVGLVPGMGWSTVCLPVNATFNDNDSISVYAAISLENNTLTLKKVTNQGLKAGYGYVIYAKAPAQYNFYGTYNTVIPMNGDTYSLLDGNPEDHAVSVGTLNIYTLAQKKEISDQVGFYQFVGKTIPARKAYLSVDHMNALGLGFLIQGAKGMQMRFIDDEDFEEEATGVDVVSEDDDDDKNFVFDLAGKRIPRSQMRKGMIYVIDGEKVVWDGE